MCWDSHVSHVKHGDSPSFSILFIVYIYVFLFVSVSVKYTRETFVFLKLKRSFYCEGSSCVSSPHLTSVCVCVCVCVWERERTCGVLIVV